MTANLFPRGLSQPREGFRFAVDSLLLSVFLTPREGDRILDLGCGCGVIGLGMLLAHPDKHLQLLGVDNNPEMIEHARENSSRLHLVSQTSFKILDAAELNSQVLAPESWDTVLMNPPYRMPGTGRTPGHSSKRAATFGSELQVEHFFQAASFALKKKGIAGMVCPASRLDHILAGLNQYFLKPKQILPVHGRPNKAAKLVLIQARKSGGSHLEISFPLTLYDDHNRLTSQAQSFCPYLACNVQRES